MPSLKLRNSVDEFDLDAVYKSGHGVQALAGVTGLGLPPVNVQWSDGAGDGSVYRSRRVQARDIDLPLYVAGENREALKTYMSRLALMLSEPCELVFVEEDGSEWFTSVARVGGGSYSYGNDTTGESDLRTVLTLRAGDPYFTAGRAESKSIVSGGAGGAFLTSMVSMSLFSSQAIGSIPLENIGDADAYPVWIVTGPGRNFRAALPSGEAFEWAGTLGVGETLVVDTKAGSVRDGTGASRYGSLLPAPRLWTIPPGTTEATASMLDTTSASRITCAWRPRRWLVI
jgi:hypothetical protein